ncbi:Nuclear cap-binding protein subunit 2 [Astathelohania contejeani]|uniref:Nuclear cap-binding protein subunit 2 n=1 Tax=Astathelohania contejeani TaxID=164912 RepID=A0ABQ7HZZ0_9MICR|nr:Nuclear cap-binding protein subunit 2 [Thelohania contejeani]
MNLEKYFPVNREMSNYRDRTFVGTDDEYYTALRNSSTIYIGQLDQAINEERLWAMFSLCGDIKRIIMGVNKKDNYFPCGFCFIEFYKIEDANKAVRCFNNVRLNDKHIKCDIDYGFIEGRQYGRGAHGGQHRDDNIKIRKIR